MNIFHCPHVPKCLNKIRNILNSDLDVEAIELYAGHADVIFLLVEEEKILLATWYNTMWDIPEFELVKNERKVKRFYKSEEGSDWDSWKRRLDSLTLDELNSRRV